MAHFITLVVSIGIGVLAVILMTVTGYYLPQYNLALQFLLMFAGGVFLGYRFPGQYLPTLTGLCLPFVIGVLLAIRVILNVTVENDIQVEVTDLMYMFSPVVAALAGVLTGTRQAVVRRK